MDAFLNRPLIEFVDLEALERVFETGQIVSERFEIRRCVGEGGMGIVYKARDTHLDRFVALKVLPPEKIANADRTLRFINEAKAASALNPSPRSEGRGGLFHAV